MRGGGLAGVGRSGYCGGIIKYAVPASEYFFYVYQIVAANVKHVRHVNNLNSRHVVHRRIRWNRKATSTNHSVYQRDNRVNDRLYSFVNRVRVAQHSHFYENEHLAGCIELAKKFVAVRRSNAALKIRKVHANATRLKAQLIYFIKMPHS